MVSKILVVINEDSKNYTYSFDSDNEFDKWADQSKYATKFSQVRSVIAEAKKHEGDDNTNRINQINQETDRVTEQLNKLSDEMHLPISSIDLLKEAKKRGIIDSAVLFDGKNCNGAWVPLAGPFAYPDFNWFRNNPFDNRSSSIILAGTCVLYQYPWFGGRALWLVGLPFWCTNLGDPNLNFDKMASSGWVTGP